MYDWLRKECEGRSVAEMSIFYSVTAVASLVALILLWAFLPSLTGGADDRDAGFNRMVTFLVALFLWVVFFVWLWIGLVRAVWKWGGESLGISVFKYFQIAVFVMFALTALLSGDFGEDFKTALFVLLAFDIVVVWLIANFLILAWFARCKIPLHGYWEIGSIIAMVVLQVLMLT